MNSDNIWAENIPAEILTSICHYNVLSPASCYHAKLQPPFLRNIINISQVCQRWYYILTSDPMLWNTSINPHHPRPEWTNLLLDRSKSLPIAFLTTTEKQTLQEVYREMKYADKVFQYLFIPTWEASLELEVVPRHWPHLSSLCLNGNCFSAKRLPEDFPGLGIPNLSILHLHSCVVSHPTQITQFRATLKELRISESGLSHPYQFSLSSLLSIIGDLPNMRRLYLANAISNEGLQVDEQFTPVILDLEELFLEENAQNCLRLMQRIDISRTTRALSIECIESSPTNPKCFTDILDHIPPLYNLHRHLLNQHSVLSLDHECMVVSGFGSQESFNPHSPRSPWRKTLLEATDLQYGYLAFATTYNHMINLSSLIPHVRPLLDNIEVIDMWNIFGIMDLQSWELLSTLIIESSTRVRCMIGVQSDLWGFIYKQLALDTLNLAEFGGSNLDDSSYRYPLANLEVLVLVNETNPERLMHTGFEDELINFCSTLQARGSPLCYIKIYSLCVEISKTLTQEMNRLGVSIEVEENEAWQWR